MKVSDFIESTVRNGFEINVSFIKTVNLIKVEVIKLSKYKAVKCYAGEDLESTLKKVDFDIKYGRLLENLEYASKHDKFPQDK